jgi:hypothetical protein
MRLISRRSIGNKACACRAPLPPTLWQPRGARNLPRKPISVQRGHRFSREVQRRAGLAEPFQEMCRNQYRDRELIFLIPNDRSLASE